jgi:hypothetical protein
MVCAGVMPSISTNEQILSHVAAQVIYFVVVSSIREPIECIAKEDLRLDWRAMRTIVRSV